MQATGVKAVSIAFERPMLDPELRPALVRLPDPVRFAGWIERKARASQFDSRPDERTGLPRIVLVVADLAPCAGRTLPGALNGVVRTPKT